MGSMPLSIIVARIQYSGVIDYEMACGIGCCCSLWVLALHLRLGQDQITTENVQRLVAVVRCICQHQSLGGMVSHAPD